MLYTTMNAGTGAGDVRGLAAAEAMESMIRHAQPESILRVMKSIQTAAHGAIKDGKAKEDFLEWCLEMLEKVRIFSLSLIFDVRSMLLRMILYYQFVFLE